jgi:hypothetical protein
VTPPRPVRWLVTLVGLALGATACGTISTSPPPAGPDDFPGISRQLAARGVTIANVVSGESGCDDPDLGRTAIRFDASGQDQAEALPMHLYIFRNRAAWERNRETVRSCAVTYVDDPTAPPPIEVSPYILVAPARLPRELDRALREALDEAAGTGG